MITDERQGWTSASNAEADSLCPGRHLISRGLPFESTPEATTGTRIHAWLACDDVQLSDEELEIAEGLSGKANGVIDLWKNGKTLRGVHVEERLWHQSGRFQHSGKPDAVFTINKRGLILDFKTGRNEVTPNHSNLQLRDLAVMAAMEYKLDEVAVAIIPAYGPVSEPCVYTQQDLAVALSQMEERITASNDPNSKRIPGEVQCKYCKAKGICPEFKAAQLPATTAADFPAAICNLDSEKLGQFLALVRLGDDVATKEVRRRLDLGDVVPGWNIKPGRVTETIVNAQEVFNRFIAAGGTPEKFMDAVKITKAPLKSQLREVTQLKGKGLDQRFDDLISGCVDEKQSAPILAQE